MNSSVRSKIEKFIDSHGLDLVLKINRKRKHQSVSSVSKEKTDSPSSVISEDINKYSKSIASLVQQQSQPPPMLSTPESQPQPQPQPEDNVNDVVWDYTEDIPTSPSLKKRVLSSEGDSIPGDKPPTTIENICTPIRNEHLNGISTPTTTATPNDKPSHAPTSSSNKDDGYYYSRRSRGESPYSSNRDKLYGESSRYSSGNGGEYVRPGYSRPPHYNAYNASSYYRYPPPSSGPYYRSSNPRYYSGGGGSRRPSPPPYYHRPSASSSRRGSLSDDEMDRRRWD